MGRIKTEHSRITIATRFGLMGVSDNGTLYAPNGQKLLRLPVRLANMVQKIQHKIATTTWRCLRSKSA